MVGTWSTNYHVSQQIQISIERNGTCGGDGTPTQSSSCSDRGDSSRVKCNRLVDPVGAIVAQKLVGGWGGDYHVSQQIQIGIERNGTCGSDSTSTQSSSCSDRGDRTEALIDPLTTIITQKLVGTWSGNGHIIEVV